MAQISMTNAQKTPFTLNPSDLDGTPRPIENLVFDPKGSDLTMELNADGVSGFIVSGSQIGTFPFSFSADARIGDGEVIIVEDHEATVSVPEATSLSGSFGAPVPK